MNDVDQEMQQSGVSKDGVDNDLLAEDERSLMLEGEEDMLAIQKLGEGGNLEGRERIVIECYGIEVEEDGHCLKEGERGCEDEDGDFKQIEEKDDSSEGEISTKSYITRYSNALESSEESTLHQDDDTLSISAGLKVNDQLVAYATRFLAVRLKKKVWSHQRALKAKA